MVPPVSTGAPSAGSWRRCAGLPDRASQREMAGVHGLRPGLHRSGCHRRCHGVPLFMGSSGRTHWRATGRAGELAAREARDRRRSGARQAGRPRTRRGAGRRTPGERRTSPGAGHDRAPDGRPPEERARRQGAPETAVYRTSGQQAAPGGSARRRVAQAGNRGQRNAGDDQPPDREEAPRFWRGGARGAGLAGPGDHALRDRARHRREGLAGAESGEGPGAVPEPGVDPRGGNHSRQELHGAGVAQRQAPIDPALGNPGLAGLQRGQVHADHGAGQGHHRQSGGGRSGQDAACAGGGHHRLRQVGRHQRDDPEPALQGRGTRRAVPDDRPQDAGDVVLRRHSAPAGAGGDRHEAGGQWPELVRGRNGAPLQAAEQAGRAQPGGLQRQDRRGEGARASSSTTRSA